MPWKVSGAVGRRIEFIEAYQSGFYQMAELCRAFGISRQNGYKWLARYREHGAEGLHERSRAPSRSPQQTAVEIESLLLESRRAHPTWGPRKIRPWLVQRDPDLADQLPAPSTIGDLFRRHGLVQNRRRHRRRSPAHAAALQVEAPNEVWTADFKGEFRLKSGPYCYPFTLADAYSRFLLSCRAEASTSSIGVRSAMERAFREFGLPQAIRTDNGTPFVGHGCTGLSALVVWWIQLGIRHDRIPPSRPDQNGRHERMHRTLKAEATRPPESSFADQQRRFDAFVNEFNQERPHEALDQKPPATRYARSDRPYRGVEAPEYPAHYEPRKVDAKGCFKFRDRRIFIAQPLAGHWLGLVEIEPDVWSICFHDSELGRINPRSGDRVFKVSPMSPV